MATAFDGTYTPTRLAPLPCGGIPEFDEGSGYSYRCNNCGAVIGSIAMPKNCARMIKDITDRKAVKEIIGFA